MPIKMERLRATLLSAGFKKVTPVLASGNVVLQASLTLGNIQKRIEQTLEQEFRTRVLVILRDAAQFIELVDSNPFEDFQLTAQSKLQVTFLAREARPAGKLPVRLPVTEFQVVQVSRTEICSAVDLSSDARTPELMQFLEKQFGTELTTRTWSTIEKIAKVLWAE